MLYAPKVWNYLNSIPKKRLTQKLKVKVKVNGLINANKIGGLLRMDEGQQNG